jgi:hypothetical protein
VLDLNQVIGINVARNAVNFIQPAVAVAADLGFFEDFFVAESAVFFINRWMVKV